MTLPWFHRQIVAFIAGLVLSVFSGLIYFNHVKDETQALAVVLKEARVIEEVVHNGTTYIVASGSIEPRPRSSLIVRSVFQTAYAKRRLRVDPPFALPGADIGSLADSIEALTEVERLYLSIDAPLIDKLLVRYSLFPTGALEAAVDAEAARRDFLRSGDRHDLERYLRVAKRLPRQYIHESYRFEIAYRYLAPEIVRYVTERHSITKENTLATLHMLRDRMRARREVLEAFADCVRGRAVCDGQALRYPVVDVFEAGPALSANVAASFYEKVGESSPLFAVDRPTVLLIDGYCQNPEVPQMVRVLSEEGGQRLIEGADIRFLRPSDYIEVPFFRYFVAHDFAYIPSNPFSHYSCVAVPQDQGAALAALEARDLALSGGLRASTVDAGFLNELTLHEAALESDILREADARSYVRLALAGVSSGAVLGEWEAPLLELSLLFKHKTAGVEHYVRHVAGSETNNVHGLIEGSITSVPLDRAFFTRSAFVPFSTILVPDIHPKELHEAFSLPKAETPYYYLSDLVPEQMTTADLLDIYSRYHLLH